MDILVNGFSYGWGSSNVPSGNFSCCFGFIAPQHLHSLNCLHRTPVPDTTECQSGGVFALVMALGLPLFKELGINASRQQLYMSLIMSPWA